MGDRRSIPDYLAIRFNSLMHPHHATSMGRVWDCPKQVNPVKPHRSKRTQVNLGCLPTGLGGRDEVPKRIVMIQFGSPDRMKTGLRPGTPRGLDSNEYSARFVTKANNNGLFSEQAEFLLCSLSLLDEILGPSAK